MTAWLSGWAVAGFVVGAVLGTWMVREIDPVACVIGGVVGAVITVGSKLLTGPGDE